MTATPQQTSNPDRKVPTRRISFEESLQELPKHFAADGDLILSHLAASLSSVFPDGEDFFVRSVRHYRDQITDPELKRQVTGFIGQEALHGREHRMFNDRLHELGYPTKRFERLTRKGLELRERVAPPISNLAATAALEHFTATLAELVLRDEQVRGLFGHDEVRNLFLWHALEESEHKAVAFDLYRHVGGREWVRRLVMNTATGAFVAGVSIAVALGLVLDERARRDMRAALQELRASPFFTPKMWQRLRDYNRRDFHPDDVDTSQLVAQWRKELFGDDGKLRSRVENRRG